MNLHLTYDDIAILPKYSEVTTRTNCELLSHVTQNIKIKIPIVSSPMDTVTEVDMAAKIAELGGIGFIHRFMPIDAQAAMCHAVAHDGKLCGAAVGTKSDFLQRAIQCLKNKASVIVIDTAHGHHLYVKNALQELNKLKQEFTFDILAGSIVTSEAARDLIEWGADGLRCGVASGSLCETSIRTGIFCPQASSIMAVVKEAVKYNIPVCADGGIRKPSDAAKAFALGASSVMLGGLLSATKESPGEITKIGMWPNEQLFKKYQGSASADSKKQRGEDVKNIEGNSTLVSYKGSIGRIIEDICDGVKSCMSYLNALTLTEMWYNAKDRIVQVTHAGYIEGMPHLMLNK